MVLGKEPTFKHNTPPLPFRSFFSRTISSLKVQIWDELLDKSHDLFMFQIVMQKMLDLMS